MTKQKYKGVLSGRDFSTGVNQVIHEAVQRSAPLSEREIIIKMALAIKRVIDWADAFNNEPRSPVCILPKDDRQDLGQCLDDLGRLR